MVHISLITRSSVSKDQIRKMYQEESNQSNLKGNSNKEKIVFVSHSFAYEDTEKSKTLQDVLKKYSISSYLAENDPQYGYLLSNKIREAIQKSVAVVVILTKNSIISASVNQEIGYALGLGRRIIPMVSDDDVKGKVGVLLKDVEGEIFKQSDFEEKCEKVAQFISKQINNLQIPTADDKNLFNKEREFLNPHEENILKKIKSKGYWEVSIRPNSYNKNKLRLEECKEIIKKCQVKSHDGYYYPEIGNKPEEFFVGENCVVGLIDSYSWAEAWRFYRSGQFVHHFVFFEDWAPGIRWRTGFRTNYDDSKPLKVKGIIMTLDTVAEIFKFASNLANVRVFEDKIHILLKLHDTEGRSLATSDQTTILRKDFKCMIDKITFEKTYDVNTFNKNLEQNVMDAVKEILLSFNWDSQDIEKCLTPYLKDYIAGNYTT